MLFEKKTDKNRIKGSTPRISTASGLLVGIPLTWGFKRAICKQLPEVSLFTNYQTSALNGLGGVREKSDWLEKIAPFGISGYDQMKLSHNALPNRKHLKSFICRYSCLKHKIQFLIFGCKIFVT